MSPVCKWEMTFLFDVDKFCMRVDLGSWMETIMVAPSVILTVCCHFPIISQGETLFSSVSLASENSLIMPCLIRSTNLTCNFARIIGLGMFDEALVGLNALINVLCGIHGIMFVSICKGIWLHRVKVCGYITYADILACRLQKGKKTNKKKRADRSCSGHTTMPAASASWLIMLKDLVAQSL